MKNMNAEITISVRGMAASGKTTVAKLIADMLKDQGFDVSIEYLDGSEKEIDDILSNNFEERIEFIKKTSVCTVKEKRLNYTTVDRFNQMKKPWWKRKCK